MKINKLIKQLEINNPPILRRIVIWLWSCCLDHIVNVPKATRSKTDKKKSKMARSPVTSCLTIALCFFSVSLAQAQFEDWIYKVRAGDNLWDISEKYLIDVSYAKHVQKINKISDPENMLPGSEIKIPSQWIRHSPALVRVINLQGTAHSIEQGSDKPRPLKEGAIVVLGDTIITDAGSTLVLGFLDGSRILLEESSRLKIDRLMLLENTGMLDSHIKLESGRMEIQAVPDKRPARQFKIETPAAVTSVRGTKYRVSAETEKNESRTEVLEGLVNVKGKKNNHPLAEGFGTVIVKNQEPLPPIKLLPPPDINQVPVLFNKLPVQFSMSKPIKGQSYRLQIAKTELFRNVLFNNKYNSDNIRASNLPDGQYFLRLRSIDTQQLEGHNSQKQFTINALPESPFLVSPKTGEGIVIKETPKFNWSEQKNIDNYHFQISKDESFSSLLVDKPLINNVELSIDDELALGKYYWRVAAIDQEGDGPFSDGQMFRRIMSASLEAPEISDESLVIRSRKGLEGQKYHFQMAKDDSFSELLLDEHTDQPSFETPRPDGGEYFVRVRTIDPDGFIGPYTTPQSINIPYNLYWLLTLLPLLALIAL